MNVFLSKLGFNQLGKLAQCCRRKANCIRIPEGPIRGVPPSVTNGALRSSVAGRARIVTPSDTQQAQAQARMGTRAAWALPVLLLALVARSRAIIQPCSACQSIAVRSRAPGRTWTSVCCPTRQAHAIRLDLRRAPLRQAELAERVRQEGAHDPIDLRNRLDSQGNRYGKVVDFRRAAALHAPALPCRRGAEAGGRRAQAV